MRGEPTQDELERALTGGTGRRGLSPVGWIFLSLGFFALVGTLGAGFVAYKVADGVREVTRQVTRELGVAPGVAAARMAARLASPEALVAMEPEEGVAFLSEMDDAQTPAEFFRAMADPGGAAAVDSDDVRVRVEVVDGQGGGQLRIEADDRQVMASFGDGADGAPGWVEGLRAMPGGAQPVISLRSDRGLLGAVAWEAGEPTSEILSSYRQALEAEGYEVKIQHRVRNGAEEHGSLWARHEADDRMVFVVAHAEDGDRTGVLLGYGEGG